MPYVSELHIYPLKSAKGLSLTQVSLDQRGPSLDRRWMVVSNKDRFITQRQKPKMCLIETTLTGQSLSLNAPGMTPISIATNNLERQVFVWKDSVNSVDCGDTAAQWLSDFLETDCRLVYMPEQTQRLVDPDYATQHETVSFADGFPSLIISQSSLDDFNKKLDIPIKMVNFRPNIVIAGCAAYAEDTWKEIRINGITFSLVKPCSRCIIPSIDSQTGIKNSAVTHALNTHRRRDRASYFGQNALHDKPGNIHVGDNVELVS